MVGRVYEIEPRITQNDRDSLLLDSICKRLWLTPCIPYIRHVNNITAFLVIINKGQTSC